ncbi:MAG TPA: T9SS type A sorting domain-containing protein [Bacteroidales bacterium]|nr:T9SS type A sorting domain-containing protein [Bacteroidales bacterium]
MKKLLLFSGMLFACVAMQAQTIVFQENFDTYTAGDKIAVVNTNFTTWSAAPGGSEDGTISTEQAASPSNSLKIVPGNDVVFPIANFTSGEYVIEFDYYVPSTGPGAYFNVLHNFAGTSSEWALECYFYNNGTGYLMVGGSTADQIAFTYPSDQFFHVYIKVDLTEDEAKLEINNTEVHTWPFHYTPTETTGLTQLGGVNFFSAAPHNLSTGTYYIDNFKLIMDDVAVNESNNSFKIYPNPATTLLTIIGNDIQKIEVYNLVGQKIYTGTENTINTETFAPGTYFVKVTTSKGVLTKKAVIK